MGIKQFNAVKSGEICICPLCNFPLGKSEMGVNNHLRKHVRAKEITQEELLPLRLKTLGHRFIKYEERNDKT